MMTQAERQEIIESEIMAAFDDTWTLIKELRERITDVEMENKMLRQAIVALNKQFDNHNVVGFCPHEGKL